MLVLDKLILQASRKSFTNSTQKIIKVSIGIFTLSKMTIWLLQKWDKSKALSWSNGNNPSASLCTTTGNTPSKSTKSIVSVTTPKNSIEWSLANSLLAGKIAMEPGMSWLIADKSLVIYQLNSTADGITTLPAWELLRNKFWVPLPSLVLISRDSETE